MITGRSLASYRMILKDTGGFSRLVHEPALRSRDVYDRIICPACAGNPNRTEHLIRFTDGTWENAASSEFVRNIKKRFADVTISVDNEWRMISLIDIVQVIEVYDAVEGRTISFYRDGQHIWEPCPICHNTGKQLFEVRVTPGQISGHNHLLKGYFEISDMAEFCHLPSYQQWLDKEQPHASVSHKVTDWFVQKHLIDGAEITHRDRTDTWYACPECDGLFEECQMCDGTGEVTGSYLLERFEDEFIMAVEEDPECPYRKAYDTVVLEIFNTFVLAGSRVHVVKWPNGEMQLHSPDWKNSYEWFADCSLTKEPPAGTYRQRVMWILATQAIVWDTAYARSKFYFIAREKVSSL